MKMKNIDAQVFGEYGGKDLASKLKASTRRTLELIDYIVSEKPELAISFSSPECARVAFGLGIPLILVNDSPHSIFVAKLTIPLSRYLFSPYVIPKKAWVNFGISEDRIFQYKAIDPVAWLKNFKPNKKVLNSLNIDTTKKLIVIRETEMFASYLGRNFSSLAPISDNIVPNLLSTLGNKIQIIILPRYNVQVDYLVKKYFKTNVIVARKVVDGASLLYYSDLLIGGGGTMNAEAALLGVPVISVFPGEITYVEDFLIREKLLIRLNDPRKIIEMALKLLQDEELREEIRERASKLLESMENPAEFITNKIIQLFCDM